MEIIVCKDYDEMSKRAATIVKEVFLRKDSQKLGLATGSTPIGLYKALIDMYKNGEISFKNTTSVNLDEYCGIERDNDQSYYYFMHENLFDNVDIDEKNVNVPIGAKGKEEESTRAYDEILDKVGRRDIQVLGLGENGHIAFNEPATSLSVRTSIVKLTEDTINVNSRFFEKIEDVPTSAITMGIGDILNADKIIILANGDKKQKAVKRLVEERMITTDFPASTLYTHPDVVLIVDEKAYGDISR